YAGKSNIMLGKKATRVFVASEGMEKFFPSNKIMITGNPVRATISNSTVTRSQGLQLFSLQEDRRTLLVVGGSLGAKTINESIGKHLDELTASGLQLIWQTGKPYAAKAQELVAGKNGIWINDFITQMEFAYAAADIVVARAGAMTVAELCVVKKPVLFVPYPFAAEDHQTVNARQLVSREAAWMVKDSEALDTLVPMILDLAGNEAMQKKLTDNIGKLAMTDADNVIAREVLKLIKND
ncbi:MAG TPA: glycosyltransferase, partial [Chitinophagaceae bacterium]|nr:glycosyltransferase [Chitinophagaceae bacterium]